MKIVSDITRVLALVAVLSGCQAESPAFTGKWVEQGTVSGTPHTLEISLDRGVYTVAETIAVGGMAKTVHDVAKVESKTVLSVKSGLRSLTLKDGVLHYRTKSFVKAPN